MVTCFLVSLLCKQHHSCFLSCLRITFHTSLVRKLNIQNYSTQPKTWSLETFKALYDYVGLRLPLQFSSLSLNMLTSGLDYEGWVSGMKWAARIECSCPRMNGATHSGEDNERKEKSGFQKQMAHGAIPLASHWLCLKFGLLLYMPLGCFEKTSCVAITYL